MIKICAYNFCSTEFETNSSQKKFCSPKCKKRHENSLRTAPSKKQKKGKPPIFHLPSIPTTRPQSISQEAGLFWDELAPVISKRGHLNILSKRILEIYCVLQAKIDDILKMIDIGTEDHCDECGAKNIKYPNRSLLQLDDKWDNSKGTETQSFKESPLSVLLRQYTARSLDYAKQLYLTPLSNRGNFGLEEDEEKKPDEADKSRFF